MSKKPRKDKPTTEDSVITRFPGLAADKNLQPISVQRPIEIEQKTYTEKPRSTASPAPAKTPGIANNNEAPNSKLSEPEVLDDSETTGTVLELPPSPEQRKAKRRRVILASLLVTALLLVGGWSLLYFTPLLAVEDVEIEGTDLVATSEAQDRTEVLLGTPIPQLNDEMLTQLFEDSPAVKTVTFRAELPHGVVVVLEEHKPVAMSPSGKQYVVFSEQGTELAEIPSKRAQEFDLPVVASASDVADQQVFATITEVLGTLPEELRDQVKAASGSSIDSIELELMNEKIVMWGNTGQADQKIRVLEALLGLDEKQTAEIREYDVSAPDFPVTR